MEITTDHQRILLWLYDRTWHCQTELDYMFDRRKRISELNEGYPKDNLRIEGISCDGRCNTKHRSKTLKMRRLNPYYLNSTQTLPAKPQSDKTIEIKVGQEALFHFSGTLRDN